MGRKHCRKGEIAHYEQFLLSRTFFERLVQQTLKNQGLFGKGLTLNHTFPTFKDLVKEAFKKHSEKR